MQDIERLLTEGSVIQFKPLGSSMYPLIVPGRDEAVVAPIEGRRLRRGDVALYRRDGGILVLHRVWKNTASGLYLVGDNQREIEGPLRPDQVRGILVGVVRKGRYFSAGNIFYRTFAGLWLCLRPLRPAISRSVRLFKDIFGPGEAKN